MAWKIVTWLQLTAFIAYNLNNSNMYTDFFIKDAFPQWIGDTESVCKIFLLIDKLCIIKIEIIFATFNKKLIFYSNYYSQ